MKKDLIQSIRNLLTKGADPRAIKKLLWENYGNRYATLALDCCKFTRISQEEGIVHYLVNLVKLTDIIKPVFETHNCVSFRCEADNIYAEFPTADQALEASLATHKAIQNENLMLTEAEPFQVCVGIGFGDVLCSQNNGVFGDEMNLASKLGEDIAKGGEILLTAAAFFAVDKKYQDYFVKHNMVVSSISVAYYKYQP
jgi:adenylate cyclase